MINHRGWLQNKHVETMHYRWVFVDRSLDDDRSGGRVDGMEWCGEGYGWGWGWGLGGARGEGEGKGTTVPFLDCSHMMTVLCV